MCLCKVQIAIRVSYSDVLSLYQKNTRTAIRSCNFSLHPAKRPSQLGQLFAALCRTARGEIPAKPGLISFKFPRLRGIADRARFSRSVLTLERFGDETRFVRLYPREQSAARGCMRVCARVCYVRVYVYVYESGVVPGEVTDARRAA